MKQILFILLLSTAYAKTSFAQSMPVDLPSTTLIPHYRLSISYNTTTVLIFPAAVRPVDRGDRDVLALKQPGVDNVLKLKAGRRNFGPTNLHVFTSDGRVYAFDITYTDSLATSHDLTNLLAPKNSSGSAPIVYLTNQSLNDAELNEVVQKLHESTTGSRYARVSHERMSLTIDAIAQHGPLLFFRLQVRNKSNLQYQMDFLRCFIKDRQKSRRTSIQEREIPLSFQDTATLIEGRSSTSLVIAMPIFTLANGKEAVIELFEHNGGRSLILRLHNRILLRARPI